MSQGCDIDGVGSDPLGSGEKRGLESGDGCLRYLVRRRVFRGPLVVG